jgi:hypothetical protein
MTAAGRLHPSAVTHQPDAYVLLSRLILGDGRVSQADRHITAVATFISTARELLRIVAAMMAPCSVNT